MPQASEKINPYDNVETQLWKLERRIHKSELVLDSMDQRMSRIEESIRDLKDKMFNYALVYGVTIVVASTLFKALFDSIGQRRDKKINNRNSTIRFKSVCPRAIIFLSSQINIMKKRSEQQMIDPYDVPREDTATVYVEEIENITEELELTLEQLQEAYKMTQSLQEKIWAKKRTKDGQR